MKTSIQIAIDNKIIHPINSILNIAVRFLGFLLNIDHNLDKNFKSIAICKYKGMGSIVQATPLIQTLKKKFPESNIIFITTPANVELLKLIKDVDKVITINDMTGFALLFKFPVFIYKLLKERIEVYIDLEVYSNFSSLVSILAKPKNRFGYYLKSSNYRLGIYTHMMYFNPKSPIHQAYLQFARILKCDTIIENIFPLKSTYIPKTVNANYIVINPNASDLRIERKWPKVNYISLLKHLVQQFPDFDYILIGSKQEAAYVNLIISELPKNATIYSLAGKTNIHELIGIINHASLMVTNDSGPMHIAFSGQTNTVALFGPCSPDQYGGNTNSSIVYKNVYCSPCVHEFIQPPCKGNNQCMKMITVEEVKKIITELLNNRQKYIVSESSEIQYANYSNSEIMGLINR